ncbi:MAG: PorV/PorQ family protein [bacterium]|nr:PorV/PorQ family protein [bacterium]
MKRAAIYGLVLFCWTVCPSSADTGETTATFLELGAGGRATALAEAYTGLGEGVNSFYWNPAGAAFLGYTEVTAMHAEWFEDTRYDYVAFAKPFSWGTIGLDGVYLNHGLMEYYPPDSSPNEDHGNFSATDMAFSGGYARALTDSMSVGATGKLIYSKIHTETAIGFASNLGFYWKLPVKGLSVGVVGKNLGPGMTYVSQSYPIPMTATAGAAYRVWDERIIISVDGEKPFKDDIVGKIGLEINPHYIFSGRVGYLTQPDTKGISGLSGGLGVNVGSFAFDFTYSPYDDLGDTYRIGLTYSFGKERGRITEEVERRMAAEFDKQKKEMIKTLSVKAKNAFNSANYQEAIDSYDVILVWDPENLEAQANMAQAQALLDEEKIAEHIGNAAVFMDEEKYTEAVLEYSLAVDIDPTDTEAVSGLAVAEEKLAELEAKQAEEIAELLEAGREAYKRGDFETAVNKWRAVLDIDPDNEEAAANLVDAEARIAEMVSEYISKAKSYEASGNWVSANRFYAKAARLDPDNDTATSGKSRTATKISSQVDSYNSSGIELYKQGQYDASEAKFYEALNLEPGNSTANSYIAKIKDKREAKPAESKVKDYSSVYLKGIEAYTKHEYRTAIAYWEQIPSKSAYYKKAQSNILRAKKVLKKLGG